MPYSSSRFHNPGDTIRLANMNENTKKNTLVLEDGTTFEGVSFGASGSISGEVVFNTAMTGYVEILTDPSYRGQILVCTYPLVGNYGVPPGRAPGSICEPFEADEIQVQGLIVQHYIAAFSHHTGSRSLGEWLTTSNIPAITGIDTRTLTRHLREVGTMRGWLFPSEMSYMDARSQCTSVDMQREVFELVAPSTVKCFGEGESIALLIDVGAKDNIVRSLVARGIKVLRVPWHHDLQNYVDKVHGVIIGNGPGDPSDLMPLVEKVRWLLQNPRDIPIMGICLGNQILALAAGATTYKLPYGHRGVNQPVQDLITGECFISSQNHGYAVKDDSLPLGWEPWFLNLNDGTNEGIRSQNGLHRGVQFHPEARPGPKDTTFVIDDFVSRVRERSHR